MYILDIFKNEIKWKLLRSLIYIKQTKHAVVMKFTDVSLSLQSIPIARMGYYVGFMYHKVIVVVRKVGMYVVLSAHQTSFVIFWFLKFD